MSQIFMAALPIVFSLFIACFATCAICGAALFFFKAPRVNAVLKHPYLEQRPYTQYPFAIKATIFLDYFFRLIFPNGKFWVLGQANRMLAHVQPREVPLDVKWPIVGFWGACWLGLPVTVVLWGLLMLIR